MTSKQHFDVVICGGGLAGLTLARQLSLELPELSLAVVDRLSAPLPEAAFKVGESSVELATYYFGQVLKLDAYFRSQHLPKLGLHYFFGDARGPLAERPETGPDMFPPVPSYQIDRGRLENDLRRLIVEMGVQLFEGTLVEQVELDEGSAPHIISCRQKNSNDSFELSAGWVVDALGRRRLLQNKLGLKRENGHRASAAWWRYKGRIDVDNMMPDASHPWRRQHIEDRYYSTNHFMGKGYWVWLIPLATGNTSVGIVSDDDIHPHNSYGKSHAQSLEWLRSNEPVLWEFLRDEPPLDFLSIKHFSYGSAQVFSQQRWSCVGEAGLFLDPFYSPGSDYICLTNTFTTELIRRERAGTLSAELAADYNRLLLENLYPIALGYYQGMYKTFGHAHIYTAKLAWDTAISWSWLYQLYLQGLLLNPTPEIFALGERYRFLNARVQKLLSDWSELSPPRGLHLRGDLTRMHLMMLLGLDLAARRSPDLALRIIEKNLDRMEELALVLFWQAVSECFPAQPALKQRPWVNAWKMNLQPQTWDAEGIFEAETLPRPLDSMRANLTGIFEQQTLREKLFYELPFQALRWNKGFLYYRVATFLRKLIFVNKPALWARISLVRDYRARK